MGKLKPCNTRGGDFVDSRDDKSDGEIQNDGLGSSELYVSGKIDANYVVGNEGNLLCCSESINGKAVDQNLQNVGSTSEENRKRVILPLKVENDGESLLNVAASVFVGTPCEVMQDDDILEYEEESGGGIGVEKLVCDHQDHKFCVGDIIWVETKAESWWPGKIFNPKKVPHFAGKRSHKDSLLVGYFGNDNFTWCTPTQMRPFSYDFDEISRGGRSRSFHAAVQKAVCEIGNRAKWDMSSSCSLKGVLPEKHSVIPFEPASFLAQLKLLSCYVLALNDFEITIVKSHLSAFYSALGYCETTLQGKPDAEMIEKPHDKEVLENGKGFELRERKKSKYLSPPYVNHNFKGNNLSVLGESEMLGMKLDPLDQNFSSVCKENKSPPQLADNFNSKADIVSLPEILSILRFAATYGGEKLQFDLIEDFFCRFRSSVFHGAEVLAPALVEISLPDKKHVVLKEGMINTKASLAISNANATALKTGEDGSFGSLENNPLPDLKSDQKKMSKKEKPKNQTDSSKNSFSASSINPNEVRNEVQACMKVEIPDLNEDADKSGSLVDEDAPLIHLDIVKRLLKKKKAVVNTHSLPDINKSDVLQGEERQNNNFQGQDRSSESSTGIPVVIKAESASFSEVNAKPSSVENGPKLKKRKTKQVATVPRIPDLNENSDAMELKQKKRRTDSVTPDLLANVSELLGINNGESISGTALLLAFAPNFDSPSKEALMVTFSAYGTLIESETRVIKDSNIGQVVFLNSCDAGDAFRSLEKIRPFGEGLVNYRLHNHAGASRVIKPDKIVPSKPREGGFVVSSAKPSNLVPQCSSYLHIKQNLEMMSSMLEKSGSSLCPEMRTRLESEIRSLMKKVNTIPSSSSS